MTDRLTLHFRTLPDGDNHVVTGRDAWALQQLLQAGDSGCTPIDNPGPRWSGYVYNLRKLGLAIETIHESHGAPFPGTHARYVLRSQVDLLEPADA